MAKQKLDRFEENWDKPNFINYELLGSKDSSNSPDIIAHGENLVSELDVHRDISMGRVAAQIQQLDLAFDPNVISNL